VHGEPGQFLERLQDLAAGADELAEGRADHRDHRAVAFDIHVDVAVEVGHVEQALDVVGGYLALVLEVRYGRPG
jgi:hypothetical protein